MNKYTKMLGGSSASYSRNMESWVGVDVASEASTVSLRRLAYAINMWRDYESENGGAIETIPGWRQVLARNSHPWDPVYGMFGFRGPSGAEYLIIHRGKKLYRFPLADIDKGAERSDYEIYSNMSEHRSTFFDNGGKCYILDGKHYLCVGETGGVETVSDKAYVPTTFINGEPYEQRNMLTSQFIEKCNVKMQKGRERLDDIWEYEEYRDEKKGIQYKITGVKEEYAELIEGFEYIYIPRYKTTDGYAITIGAIAQGVLPMFTNAIRMVVDAPISFEEYSLGDMVKLKEIVLRNKESEFAYNACDKKTFANDGLGYTVSCNVPLEDLWISNPDVVYPLETTVDETPWTVGICTAAEFMAVHTATKNEIFIAPANTPDWNPEKVEQLTKGVKFVECELGKYLEYEEVSSVYVIENATYKLEGGKCRVYFPEDTAVSFASYVINNDTYCAVIYRSEDRVSGEEKAGHVYPVMEPFEEITSVTTENGEAVPFMFNKERNEVIVRWSDDAAALPILIYGNGIPNKFATIGNLADIYGGTALEETSEAKDAIEGCTVSCAFDGRVFFTGNPNLPNTVFFTGRSLTGSNDPSYIGIYNYFNDGIGGIPNTAMVASASMLTVFKGEVSSDASVYYHTGQYNTDPDTKDIIPRIYPSTEGATGIPCIGAACNFADDLVFLSHNGLEGVGKQTLDLERTLTHRSARVDPILRQYLNSGAQLAEWKGYLCVLASEGRMFLADSRAMTVNESTGETQYEWFMLDGVGSYRGDSGKTEYLTGNIVVTHDGKNYNVAIGSGTSIEIKRGTITDYPELAGYIPVVPGTGDINSSTIYSFRKILVNEIEYDIAGQFENNMLAVVYIPDVGENGVFCPIHKTEEKSGGTFHPALTLTEYKGRLFFGTDDGDICVFNTDKRGVSLQIDGKPYSDVKVDEINSLWYDRCGHRYHSGMATLLDNCGYPQFAKSTVGKTLTLKAKRMQNSTFTLSARSDREDWNYVEDFTLADNSFYQTNFGNFSFEDGSMSILASKEKLKRWCEKQLYLFSDGFRCPFGIYGLSYCYTLAGRVRGR